MADALGNSFLIVVLPLYIASATITGDGFGLTESFITGLVLALFGIASSVAQPIAGRLSDRAGRRRAFVIAGLLLLAASNFAFSLTGDYTGLLAVRVIQGIGGALTITASIALVNELSANENRGGNMGTYNSLRLIGFGAGPLAAGVVVAAGPYLLPIVGEVSGFDAAFYIATLSALLSIALVSAFVHDPAETSPTSDELALAVRARDDHVLDPVFTLGMATLFMSMCIALIAPIEAQLNTYLDQGPTLFGIEFAALIVTLSLVQPLIGRVSDRYGRRVFIIIGLVLLVPTTVVQGLVVAPWQMIIARLFQGASAAMVFAPALALAGDLAKSGQSGAQLSMLTVAFGLGISFGQLASGFLIRYGFVTPFVFGAALAAIGVILVYTQVEETTASSQIDDSSAPSTN
ncbi:MFS transporter [Halococcus sp. IIIV-5B]|uniref:MFS transporter n=1 Tax=Halococcus sp. IIIV-5B TaxID=2321230 RepID=UPI0018F4123F|nr:MFS transporter [Halococcus sp. IIIV-5B]